MKRLTEAELALRIAQVLETAGDVEGDFSVQYQEGDKQVDVFVLLDDEDEPQLFSVSVRELKEDDHRIPPEHETEEDRATEHTAVQQATAAAAGDPEAKLFIKQVLDPQPVRFNDWYGVEFPRFLIDLGFADRSSGNDAGARAELDLEPGPDGWTVVMWVDRDAPAEREFPDGKKFTWYLRERFGGEVLDEGGFHYGNQDAAEPMNTDDPVECERLLRELIARNGGAR